MALLTYVLAGPDLPDCLRNAYRAGVTYATTAFALIKGVSAAFSTGESHALRADAIFSRDIALHVRIGRASPRPGPGGLLAYDASVSTQIAALRRWLRGGVSEDSQTGHWFGKAANVQPFISVRET